MKVQDIMSSSVHSVQAEDSIAQAARRMADDDVGFLPVLDVSKLVGVVTDRDIAVRAVAAGIDPAAEVRRVMSTDVTSCSESDSIEDVLETMSSEQIRRLPVCNSGKEVIGILALADAAQRDPDKSEVADTLAEICEPSGLHSQSPVFA
jgi:CBS domain-containing protein